MKEFRNPSGVHPPVAAYSHQVEIHGSERILILAGQVGMRVDGSVPDDPIAQLDVAFENLNRNLQAANMNMEDLVKLTFYLVGDMPAQERREVITSWLGNHRPCTTLVFVAGLAAPVYKVELDAWASKAE